MTTPSTPLVANLGFVESPGDSLRQPGISNRFGILPAAAGSQQPRGHSLLFFRSTHCAAAIRVYFFFVCAPISTNTSAQANKLSNTCQHTHTITRKQKKGGKSSTQQAGDGQQKFHLFDPKSRTIHVNSTPITTAGPPVSPGSTFPPETRSLLRGISSKTRNDWDRWT